MKNTLRSNLDDNTSRTNPLNVALRSSVRTASGIYWEYRKRIAGGCSFGIDWPTWCANDGASAASYRAAKAQVASDYTALKTAGLL